MEAVLLCTKTSKWSIVPPREAWHMADFRHELTDGFSLAPLSIKSWHSSLEIWYQIMTLNGQTF